MVTIYRSRNGTLETVETPAEGSWVSLVDPTSEEIGRFRETLSVPEAFLTHALDRGEQARTEREDGSTLIVLRVPFFQGEATDIPHITVPLGIILTKGYVVTVCTREVGVLQQLASGLVRGLSTTKHNRFVLHVLQATAQRYLHHLGEINKAVDALEDRLQASLRNRELLDLLKRQKSLVYFTEALKSNEVMLERLQRNQHFQAFPDDLELLEDVLTEFRQAMEMTAISSGILSQTMDAFASVISNNLNAVMKFLASVTIVLALPTLVASIFGMNVVVPLHENPAAFWLILAGSFVVAAVVVVIFWRRDWL
ncbi:MAG TPA: magnesium transporter CorA family protein [Anaerolineales bacterium]|nr:magnesium transporter CorA family protein [Anaerolineales bacterium]